MILCNLHMTITIEFYFILCSHVQVDIKLIVFTVILFVQIFMPVEYNFNRIRVNYMVRIEFYFISCRQVQVHK